MSSFDLDGRRIPIEPGDTLAAAAFRSGVRTFTRSIKSHRRRGLYCLTGDCANCLVTVDGVPGERACVTPAHDGMRIRRETGWPSVERDVLSVTDHLHWAMPVGFYYKVFARPRWLWPLAERVIRRATGTGRLPVRGAPAGRARARSARCDVLVIGGGVAGLAAAATAAAARSRVIVVDEGEPGHALPPGGARTIAASLEAEARAAGAEMLTHHTAIGIYEGASVPLVGPDGLVEVEAGRVIVATGALEAHGVFPGNDLPGVWLSRGAVRLATEHGIAPCARAIVLDDGTGDGAAEALRGVGVDVIEVRGTIVSANGGRRLTGVTVDTPEGRRSFACDGLVLSLGLSPRDTLVRMAADDPVTVAGDAATPGCSIEDAVEDGRRAGRGEPVVAREPDPWPGLGSGGFVCPCEDVGVDELEAAWREGWTNSEIVKRYTTATMGPCQGALCSRHLAAFAAAKGAPSAAGGRTTARPPVRAPRLADLVGGVHEVIDRRTALHGRHVAAGARMDRSGVWLRPGTYGDVAAEIRAVRERVGIMDVSTLGRFEVRGPDARALLDEVLTLDVGRVAPGRTRYLLALDEAGYVMDDGLLAALEDGGYLLTTTSGGADRMETWLRDRVDRRGYRAHVLPRTGELGAINVAGPHARELLGALSDDDLSRDAIPYPGHATITVAGVPCRAVSVGFVGELSFELHHPRSRSGDLWDALLEAGRAWDVLPHGLDALDVLRLEKGHIFLGQDTLPDDHPGKLGLGWAVAMDKPAFVGRASLERMVALPLERRLVGLRFDGSPQRGAPLAVDGRIVGRVTSCTVSAALEEGIGLGWIRAVDGAFPPVLASGDLRATVGPTPFYDPEGVRLRA
ncbi:MAG TPA: 2Fe-2S iron-sulfur cluster-binding protein [Actinomycetota bacterium]|nr:2Fe-2S iron-sulfur cluster-binding protein [Actinomycetota bacterium]